MSQSGNPGTKDFHLIVLWSFKYLAEKNGQTSLNKGLHGTEFWLFLNLRMNMIIDRCHCLFLLICFWVVVSKMSKKNLLCAHLSKNLFQLSHFNLVHLKDLITLFQIMLWFIGFWPILGRCHKLRFWKNADSSKICHLKS